MEKAEQFNVMLLQISQRLDAKELTEMKFLCNKKIAKKKMELVTSPIHLFRHLKEQLLISEDDPGYLVGLLDTIKRPDLVQEVERFQGPQVTVETSERDQLDDAFDFVCDNVGRDWKNLIRILGVAEPTIDQIVYANPYNMREQLMQCLNKWREKKKDGATVSALILALENCRMRLVSERLAKAINLNHGAS
ncbi:LOW QUALITY PROTEIN: FAS-associated death domain protein [Bufo gargarizans]|uniref:LOW QUALITY PROTEIN: FAS-associated death domain protein n=1 Tax=Bufo gargarizans TaxID=30331 RepID=UPI001CF435B6|nr:LOW QUALITY PROTEIN: FAS-associated death domain protein [Bufo gargarizans]